jgi:hypothetical protein
MDVDPDVFIGMHGRHKWEKQWHPIAAAAIAACEAEAGERERVLRSALEECQDKLWVIHFGLTDKAEREAAINACNMATAALNTTAGEGEVG